MTRKLLLISTFIVIFLNGCSNKEMTAGYEGPKEVSAYFTTSLMSADDLKKSLVSAGFEIIIETKVSKKKFTNIVFTHPSLVELSTEKSRGFLAGSMRAMINTETNETRISNPRYFVKAFLQESYKLHDEKEALSALHLAFSDLKPTKDVWDFDGLSTYQFMLSRPYYNDVIEAGEGTHKELKAKLIKRAKKKNIIFEYKIDEKRTLFGVNLTKRTMKFVDKIGTENAGILPWMILIEEDKATALRADYIIALSYPLLDLGGFIEIMTVPGAVEKDIRKYFK